MERREWLEILDDSADLECHVLPCSVKFTGHVNGSKFEVIESPQLSSRLRGRQLQGCRIDLRKYGYIGHTLIEENNHPEDSDNDEDSDNQSFYGIPHTRLVSDGRSFDRIVVWEHGEPPSKLDPWAGKLEELLQLSRYM